MPGHLDGSSNKRLDRMASAALVLKRLAFDEVGTRHFAGDRAAAYDRARAPLASTHGALHLFANAVLSSPDDASRVLWVGVGTGDELIHLAQMNPSWTFAVVEPSSRPAHQDDATTPRLD
jgi:hypothetical protein